MSRASPSVPGAIHVLLSCDSVGGIWNYALDLSAGLIARGIEVTLAVLGPAPAPDQAVDAARIQGLDVVVTGLPLDWTAAHPAELDRTIAGITELARSRSVDLLHLHSGALVRSRPTGPPIVVTAHSCVGTWWLAVKDGALPEDLAWRAARTGAGYRTAQRVLAPTLAFARSTAATYGLVSRPHVVPNGCVSGSRPLRATSGTVFAAGRLWDEGKGIAHLERAAGLARTAVAAAGPTIGPNGSAVSCRHIETLGRLSTHEMAARFSIRPIFVAPSLYEPFGLAVLEAASFGCPLVLADIPTFREIWGGAAIFVDPRDASTLSAALDALSEAPNLRLAWGEKAWRRAQSYGLDAMTEATIAAYSTLLGSRFEPAGMRHPGATTNGASIQP